jgi:hypothetical protein
MPMKVRPHVWGRALPRALFIATSLTATPAVACPALTLTDLEPRLPGSHRFDFGAGELRPFLVLWAERGGGTLPAAPDEVVLFARPGQPFLIAYGEAGCLLALLPTPPAELWRALRLHLGRIA